MSDTGELFELPLKELHERAGARFGAFAGWSMPITYPLGVLKEHLHTREKAGLFDISHMKLFLVTGPEAGKVLERACPIDTGLIEDGQSKYTFFLDDGAGIIDDLIVTRLGAKRFMVVANAGNAATDEAHLRQIAAGYDCRIEPLDRVFLALQGPAAETALRDAGLDLGALTFMHGTEPRPDWFASRSGYTGEDGFEVAVPPAQARALADRLIADERIEWIGLAARDSLRLEAGLCLHGQDIDTSINPVDAGLMWAIPKDLRESGAFVGADALRTAIAAGAKEKRVGLKPEGRQPVRAGVALFDEAGNPTGRVTSGGFGPWAGFPVAMGYVSASQAKPCTKLFAEVRGNRLPVEIHPLPFTPHRYRKG
ncbi:glycine cleavage system aminomethyltransferase GcvT [Aquamicrobium sp. LC103]|uniref:glycine cleavage system aminomethyltransferase GcvT n=1 Tax=Aquamicrobium sp. LC103 TaxID=1120658 RepID=UPI00063EB1B8|nr:glycine cleavage system aminomethyltransferase GcvT [Aquamicrobium sp. LC103]TKT76813.1 glycine cleavage system aminomethyltransferase GcvT [Aquamicrobium sp. LC103]